jgi:hypothetical protein
MSSRWAAEEGQGGEPRAAGSFSRAFVDDLPKQVCPSASPKT